MRKRQNGIKVKYIVSALLVLLISLITIIFGGCVSGAYAAAVDYSGVMQDLQKDENFKPEDYPDNPQDYSLQVIQIAESTDKKLFLYVYNPCGVTRPLIATCVNMSLTQSVDNTRLYNLTYVSSNGVFGKYLVNGVTVSEETERYYNITSIYRKWIKGIDEESGDDNIKNEVAFEIGKLITAKTENNTVKYDWFKTDYVVIENPYNDFISYSRGVTFSQFLGLSGDHYTDVHYVAFSTDKQIDILRAATVTYTTQSYFYNTRDLANAKYGEVSDPQYITLTDASKIGVVVNSFLGSVVSWSCIARTEDFLKEVPLNSATVKNVENTDFVLMFLTTAYEQKEVYSFMSGHSYDISGTKVANVAILRLKFETNGDLYNLGVVSDMRTGDDIPGNQREYLGFWAYIWHCIVAFFTGTATTIEIIVAIVVLFICVPFVPVLITILSLTFPAFREVMKKILKGIWWVISAPFRFIAWIIKKITGGE